MSKNLVIIPTYNESENIGRMINQVFELHVPFDIVVIDDGSPDGTADIVKEMQKEFSGRLHLLQRSGKLGLGTAYIMGFKWGLDKDYDYIFEMDADFSHNPSDLVRLYKSLEEDGNDLVVGSRYCRGGKVKDWPWDRIVLSFGASLYTRMITWMPVRDPTAGFVGYRHSVLRAIPLDKIRFVGYAFQIEMKFSAFLRKFKIKEVPITFVDRIAGVSKLSSGIVHEAAFGVIKMRWKSFFGPYP